jgi:hypothetical protein
VWPSCLYDAYSPNMGVIFSLSTMRPPHHLCQPLPPLPCCPGGPPPPPVQAALVRSEGVLRRRLQELSHDLSDASLQQVRG